MRPLRSSTDASGRAGGPFFPADPKIWAACPSSPWRERPPPLVPMTDSAWIRAALERYERPLVLHARRVTGEEERARDAVQETFLRLVRERREAVEPHLAEWLFTVCRNVALDMRRRERVMERTDGERADERPGGEPEPVAVLEQDERRGRVLALLERLPARQQEVLRLRFQAGLTYKEIQRVTGHSLGNVGYLIHVGIRTLRERLAGDALEEVAS
jgi:RNA polymerase sigma factor (sigma-70 family)